MISTCSQNIEHHKGLCALGVLKSLSVCSGVFELSPSLVKDCWESTFGHMDSPDAILGFSKLSIACKMVLELAHWTHPAFIAPRRTRWMMSTCSQDVVNYKGLCSPGVLTFLSASSVTHGSLLSSTDDLCSLDRYSLL